MALEFTKLSEVPVVETELTGEETVLIEAEGDIVRVPMTSIKSGDGKALVFVYNNGDHTLSLVDDENQSFIPMENYSDFLEYYLSDQKLLFWHSEWDSETPGWVNPTPILSYYIGGYGYP